MFLSIIIPTYNVAADIAKSIESVQAQSFGDWEILVMDGGSTDATVELVRNIAGKDPRISLWSEKDNGIYDAMNKGIARARGEWIYFLGSDDCLYDNAVLEKIHQTAQQHPDRSVIYGDVYSTRFNGRYAGAFTVTKLYEQNISHQAIFLKKNLFELLGDFNTEFKGWADYDHNIRWFLHPQIRHHYIDLVIADYADGGFSSAGIDERMLEEKAAIFLAWGGRSLEPGFRAKLLVTIAIRKKQERKYLSFLYYKMHYYFYKTLDRFRQPSFGAELHA